MHQFIYHVYISCVRVTGKGMGGVGTQFGHGRSRVTIDLRIPAMPGRSTSGFHQPGRQCLHQARSAVRCSASRMKGELHPSQGTARKTDSGTLCLLSCLWMTAPMSYTLFSGVATPETAMGITMYLPRGRLPIFTLRDAIIHLARS